MDVADAGIVGGLIAVTIALAEIIKTMVRRRNGNGNGSKENAIATEVLAVLREISQGVTALRSDVRASALEQGHLQKTADAIHSRMDGLAEKVAAKITAGR